MRVFERPYLVKEKSPKSYTVAVGLSGVFGVLGVQHFYLGRHLLGLADLTLTALTIYFFFTDEYLFAIFFFSLDFLHTIIVTTQLIIGNFKDSEGRYVCYPGQKLNPYT